MIAKKEDAEIRTLVAKAIQLELTKLELKLKYVSEIEKELDSERLKVCLSFYSLKSSLRFLHEHSVLKVVPVIFRGIFFRLVKSENVEFSAS